MLKRIFFHIIALMLLSVNIFAQESSAYEDGLINAVESTTDPIEKVNAYIKLIRYYQETDIARAIENANQAQHYAKNNKLKLKIIEIKLLNISSLLILEKYETVTRELENMESEIDHSNSVYLLGEYYLVNALYYYKKNDIAKSFEYSLKAVRSFRECKESDRLAVAYKNIGSNYFYFGDLGKALEYYKLSEGLLESTSCLIFKGKLYTELGKVYYSFAEYKTAIKYFKNAYTLFEQYNVTKHYAEVLSNIAAVHFKQKDIVDAINVYQYALKYASDNNDINNKAIIYNKIGDIYLSLNRLDSSKIYLSNSLVACETFNNAELLTQIHFSISELYYKHGDFEKAILHMTHSYHNAEKTGNVKAAQNAVIYLAKIEAARGNYQMAYNYQQISIELSDSIFKLSNIGIAYKPESQEIRRKLYLYETELEKDDLVIMYEQEEKKFLVSLILFSSILIVIILFIAYWRVKVNKRNSNKYQAKAKEVNDQKALLEISNIEIMEQYAFIETLLNTIPNPVFYTDKRNRVLGCNHAFESVCNATAEELAGVSMKYISKYSDIEFTGENIFEKNDPGLYRSEGRLKFQDGVEHFVLCYRKGIIDNDGLFIGSVGILNDVTELKSTQHNLIKSEEKLKEALDAKNKFFNIVAHDLKNPFNAVLGLSMLLVDNYSKYSKNEIIECLENINKSATQVYNLLENLLDWARTQSGALNVRPVVFSINEPIRDCLDLLRFLIEKKNIKIKYDHGADLLIRADKDMTMVIIRNILANAVKYTPENGQVSVTTERNTEVVKLTIKDNGIGIKHSNIEKLLKTDKPVSTPGADNEKGTGLGLIITREFLRLNNGSIEVKSKEGEGTEFTISIPVAG